MPVVSDYRAFVRVDGPGSVPQIQAIWDHFEHYGVVTDVYNPASAQDTSYVSFALPEELEAALLESPTIIAGVTCSVQRALPRDSAWSAREATTSPDRVYVTGLVPLCTDESLRNYFSTYGNVQDVYIPFDRSSGERKPFAFVTMSIAEEVEAIVREATHCTLDGHRINCDVAAARGTKGGKGKDKGMDYYGGYSSTYGAIAAPLHDPLAYRPTSTGGYMAADAGKRSYASGPYSTNGIRPVRPPKHHFDTSPTPVGHGMTGGYSMTPAAKGGYSMTPAAKPMQGVPGDYRIFVFGMPEGLNADMLRGHFARHGEILDIYVPANKDIAYITFQAEAEVQDALLNSGLRIAGYWVKGLKAAESKQSKGGKGKRYTVP